MNYYYYNPNELYHYGIKRRSGRYPWGSGKRPHQSLEERRSARRVKKAARIERRATKKMGKMDAKIAKGQETANKRYDQAFRKSNSFFSSQKGVDKAFAKATSAQKAVNKLEYKGSKYYKKVAKKMSKLDMDLNKDLVASGNKYLESVANNSKSIYNATMTSGYGGPKKRR